MKGLEVAIENYYLYLVHIANFFVHDEDIARDIVTGVFIKLRSDDFDFTQRPETLKSFLSTCVKNACIDHLRRRKGQPQTGQWDPAAEDLPDESASLYHLDKRVTTIGEIVRFMENQKPRHRDLFQQLLLGVSVTDAAKILDVPVSTAFRWRDELRVILSRYLYGKDDVDWMALMPLLLLLNN